MQQFEIILKNEKRNIYNRLSWLIIFIFAVFFSYIIIFPSDMRHRNISIATLIVVAACLGYKLYFKNTKYQPGIQLFFWVILTGWICMEEYLLAGFTILFLLLSAFTSRNPAVIFSKNHIIYPSLPVKSISWKDLNQLILKDGLLTIDFKSNRLIQQLVDENKTTIDEQEFNDFCRQQLTIDH